MARSLSNAMVFVSLVTQNFSAAFQRRGYAAASQGLVGLGRGSENMGNVAPKDPRRPIENSWVPDPATGYYMPANRVEEMDVAELREILLSRRLSPNKFITMTINKKVHNV